MNAKERLESLQAALREQGAVDVKFFFARAAQTPPSEVGSDVADALQAFIENRVHPLPPMGDSVRV
jgi:hypothetical protein